MKTRMKVVSCLCAMALMAGASTAWGWGFDASASIDFWNVLANPVAGDPVGNQVVANGTTTVPSVNTVVQSSHIDFVPGYTPRPNPPLATATGIIGASDASASFGQLDSTSSWWANQQSVTAISSAGLPSAASDNVDWLAVAENAVYLNNLANGIVSFQFAFNVNTLGDTISVTANTIDLMQNVDPNITQLASFRYLFTVIDPATMLDIDPLGHVAVTRTYNAAAIAALAGSEQLFQYSYTSPNTLTPGQYYLLLEAEQESLQTAAVPEPSTFILAGSGILGLFLMRSINSKKS